MPSKVKINLQSLTISVYINCQCLNLIIIAAFPKLSSFALSGVFVFTLFMFVATTIKGRKICNCFSMGIPLLILSAYVITCLLYSGESALTFVELVTYVILPFLLATMDFDFSTVIRINLVLVAPAIFLSRTIFEHSYHGGISMGVSYAFLPAVASSVIYMLNYRKIERNKYKRFIYTILSLFSVYYFYEMCFFGSRGPTLSVILLIVLIYFLKYDFQKQSIVLKHKVFVLGSIVGIFFVFAFADTILAFLYKILSDMNISVRFITKNYSLMLESNLLNGRSDIFVTTIEGIKASPVWGHGIDMFQRNTGIVYPHNIFLQLLYDGGIILFSFVIFPVINSIRKISWDKANILQSWLYLFCISVPGIMFSGDIWQKYTFWFFVAYCMVERRKRKVELVNYDNN